ncbi:MAG: flippase-like domain-containing protein [Bacteroidales bacterium]|nr:flippase-like domain-containing protein [Bacteroidales bacterium]
MNNHASNFLKTVLSIALAAVLLWYSFKGVDWAEFFAGIRHCRWGFVLLSMLAGAVAFVFRGLRWRRILEPLDPSVRRVPCVNGINISNAVNLAIPYFGELVRCGVITRHSARDPQTGRPLASYDRVLGTAILERSWDVLSVVILLLILLAFKWQQFGGFLLERVLRPLVSGLSGPRGWLTVGVLSACTAAVCAVFLLRKRSAFCRRICDVGRRFWQGFASCFRMDHKGLFFFYTGLIWLMYWLQMVLIKEALPVVSDLGVFDCLFLMLVGSFASCLPVPGGFGAYHYVVSLALFAIYGFPQATVGILFATLAHESQALTMLLTGGASYLYETFTRQDP